jgi:sulfur relay protein TusB/DsrH
MIVMIKSAPDTADGIRGVTLAKDSGADLVLLQNGVYFAQEERIVDFMGTIYVLNDDMRVRGVKDTEIVNQVKMIEYDTLTELITGSEKVVGLF